MTRYLKTPVTQLSANESAALQQINKNLDDIQSAIQDTVSRSGKSPTQMTADLDLNGKRIINAPAPLTDNDFVRRVDVVGDITTIQSLVNAASTAAGQAIAAAEGVQEAIADAHVGIVADDLMLGDDSKIRIAANNIDDISACVDDIEDIKAVGDNISNVNAVADNETNINAVNNNKTNINAVAGNKTNIDKVADISTDVSTVADNVSNIGTVVTNMSDINDCADNMSSITGASTQAANAAASAQSAASSAEQAAISAAGTHFKLFHHDWFDYQLNDMAWLRADTFSWQNGNVYSNAYQHLVDDYNNGTDSSETIEGIEVWFRIAPDGHKIVPKGNTPEHEEEAVEAIYNATGVSWYYILDTTNQRFKLPRENSNLEKYEKLTSASVAVKGNNGTINVMTSDGVRDLYIDGHPSGGSGQTCVNARGAISPLKLSTDPNTSGIVGTADLSSASSNSFYKGKKYLYFYVGQFSQSATEQTAGLNSDLFNGKVDLNAQNLSNAGKSLISGLGMPSDTYEDLTLGVSGSTYTAPANGWYECACTGTAGSTYFELTGPNYSSTASYTGGWARTMIPALKGDVITVYYGGNNFTKQIFRFIYAVGSESEAS